MLGASVRSRFISTSAERRYVAYTVNLVLAYMFVGARSFVREELRRFFGEPRHDFEVRSRNQNLPGFGEAHDALRDVDAIADDVRLAVDVLDEAHRTQIDAHARTELKIDCFGL